MLETKMKQWSREQTMKGLKELIPEINFMKTFEEFNGKKWRNQNDC